MSKEKNFINKTIQPIQTATKTLTAIPKAKPAPENAFASILSEAESKLKIVIYDFSKGKGEDAITVYFNIDLKGVYYLLECAKKFSISEPYTRAKIFGEPEKSGRFRGKCQVTKIGINHNEKGWNISIDNGYGIKVNNKNGGAYAKSGSIEIDKKSYMQVSDEDFLMIFQDAADYFRIKKDYFASKYLGTQEMKYHKMLEENYPQTSNSSSSNSTPSENTSSGNTENQPITFMDGGKKYIATINSGCKVKGNKKYFLASVNGKSLEVYIPNTLSITKEQGTLLTESKDQGKPVEVYLSVVNNRCYLRDIKKHVEEKPAGKKYEVFIRSAFTYDKESNTSMCTASSNGKDFHIYFLKAKPADLPDTLTSARIKEEPINLNLVVKDKKCYFAGLA